jgi:hypothetical protein
VFPAAHPTQLDAGSPGRGVQEGLHGFSPPYGPQRARTPFQSMPSNYRTQLPTATALQGPREDSGVPASYEPGLELVKDLYCYGRRFHPKTKIMASSLRSRKGVWGCVLGVLCGRVLFVAS